MHRISSFAQIPYGFLPVADKAMISALWTPPNDGISVWIKIAFNESITGFTVWSAPTGNIK
jgi:hypothetical protein